MAVERLPEDYRQVLLLRCRDGCSFDEIGNLMQRTSNAAQKLWMRALERLQRELGGECDG
jgi:RNA polymerase sigma-70 factor (ECF subfamily)